MGPVVVLGAGAAGEAFIAALRRFDEDVSITVVERELVGGECSYFACIPSKTLLRPLEIAYRARHATGVTAEINRAEVFAWRDENAEKDDKSQADWVEGLGAELVRGEGEVTEPGVVRVGERELPYDELMIATGSLPTAPKLDGLDGIDHWTSREGTSSSEVPDSLIVVGGGAVGCELAQFYARMGTRVSLIQSGDYLLERVDREAGELLGKALEEEGVELHLGTRPNAVARAGTKIRVLCSGEMEVEADQLLIATGRRPNVEGFGLERLDLEIGKEGIRVNERLRAGENVWAVGDVTGVALFTHVGKYQGRLAAANMAGEDRRANYDAIPAAIFTDPQIASVGDTTGEGAVTASWKLESVSRTSTYQRPKRPGLVKLFADKEHGVLVGAVAVGPEAGEWLGQLTLAVRARVPVEVLRDTIQPFPTFSEAIYFAARELDV
jgi:dihydrolipoamide dehydrogenase